MDDVEKRVRILIVDDSPRKEGLKDRVEGFGYPVILSSVLEEAQAVVTENMADLVLLDPDAGGTGRGIEFAGRILSIKRIPLLLLSSRSDYKLNELVSEIDHYGILSKDCDDFTLYSAVYNALNSFQPLGKTSVQAGSDPELEEKFRVLVDEQPAGLFIMQDDLLTYVNDRYCEIYGYSKDELIGKININDLLHEVEFIDNDRAARKRKIHEDSSQGFDVKGRHKDGSRIDLKVVSIWSAYRGKPAVIGAILDISENKRTEATLKEKLDALIKPLNDNSTIVFSDLFNIDELQKIQDQFSEATGVASLITNPDGTPITKPSRFTRLCEKIVRGTEAGIKNCYKSDAVIGRFNPDGPIIHTCLSCGLFDAGASISVGGKHLANWLIGQVRNENTRLDEVIGYADEIGVSREIFNEALDEVPFVSPEQFEHIAQFLFSLSNELSLIAYQNLQQARFINERKQAELRLKDVNQKLNLALQSAKMGTWELNAGTGSLLWSSDTCAIFGIEPQEFAGTFEAYLSFVLDEDHEKLNRLLTKFLNNELESRLINYEHRINAKDGTEKWISVRGTVFPDEEAVSKRLVGIVMDITEQKANEQTIIHASEEKELFLRDLKHRMKNSLAIISGLLSLEMQKIEKSSVLSAEVQSVFTETLSRIESISQMYEQFSNMQDMNNIEITKFISDVVRNFSMSFVINRNEIVFQCSLSKVVLGVKKAMNIGLILNELLTNAVKYAYPEDSPGEIYVALDRENDCLLLTVSDHGRGIKPGFSETDKGTGLQIIELLTAELSAEFTLKSEAGTTAKLSLPLSQTENL